jgi:hypothetical protein
MNRDTLYRSAIVDLAGAAVLTVPDSAGRCPGGRLLVDLGLQRRRLLRTERPRAYSVDSVTATKSDDGSTTVHSGGSHDSRPNCLPIMGGLELRRSDVPASPADP